MLSVASDLLRSLNPQGRLETFGQELNPESYAIRRSDMMLKGEDASHSQLGNSFSDDPFEGERFDYLLSNPPFGVEWKKVERSVRDDHSAKGFAGRFGAGLPRINDGSFLFLQHMIDHMKPVEQGGSRLAIVFNGSPLFTGGAGSGESEIRRWIIENDWLEAVVRCPTSCSTTPESRPNSGSSPTARAVADATRVRREAHSGDHAALRQLRGERPSQNHDRGVSEGTLSAVRADRRLVRLGKTGSPRGARPRGAGDHGPLGTARARPGAPRSGERSLPKSASPSRRRSVPTSPTPGLTRRDKDRLPLTRQFYKYVPPRLLKEIDADIRQIEAQIQELLRQVVTS